MKNLDNCLSTYEENKLFENKDLKEIIDNVAFTGILFKDREPFLT